MKTLTPYLNFNGNCRDAMRFYEKTIGGTLEMMTFGQADQKTPDAFKDRIMHACLTKNNVLFMASDTMDGTCAGGPFKEGNNFSLSLHCESVEEAERLFKALGEKATVTMPLQETFWATRFGMLTDQFGIHWMINLDKQK